jgi:hypothetical protein
MSYRKTSVVLAGVLHGMLLNAMGPEPVVGTVGPAEIAETSNVNTDSSECFTYDEQHSSKEIIVTSNASQKSDNNISNKPTWWNAQEIGSYDEALAAQQAVDSKSLEQTIEILKKEGSYAEAFAVQQTADLLNKEKSRSYGEAVAAQQKYDSGNQQSRANVNAAAEELARTQNSFDDDTSTIAPEDNDSISDFGDDDVISDNNKSEVKSIQEESIVDSNPDKKADVVEDAKIPAEEAKTSTEDNSSFLSSVSSIVSSVLKNVTDTTLDALSTIKGWFGF